MVQMKGLKLNSLLQRYCKFANFKNVLSFKAQMFSELC